MLQSEFFFEKTLSTPSIPLCICIRIRPIIVVYVTYNTYIKIILFLGKTRGDFNFEILLFCAIKTVGVW